MGGASTLAVATLLANAGNYALNLLLGRWLTPAEFSDANLMVALMLTVGSAAMCLQLVIARFVGVLDAMDTTGSDRLASTLRGWALAAGVGAGLLLAAPAPLWRDVFNTGSAWPFVILGAGLPAYLVQAAGRGVMQGRLRFQPLAATYIVEMVVRLGAAVALVRAGGGVEGATAGMTVSFVATWLAVRLLGGHPTTDRQPADLTGVRGFAGSVSVLLVAQVVINNGDLMVAKAFLAPYDAGLYAAVALVGRAVFFLCWSVASVVFPASARRHAAGERTGRLMAGAAVTITGIGTTGVVFALLFGDPALRVALGPEYGALSGPLAAYAAVTTLFAVVNLIASQRLATGRIRESWLLLGGAALQTVLVLAWHDSMSDLIAAQLVAMSVVLAAVAASTARPARVHTELRGRVPTPEP